MRLKDSGGGGILFVWVFSPQKKLALTQSKALVLVEEGTQWNGLPCEKRSDQMRRLVTWNPKMRMRDFFFSHHFAVKGGKGVLKKVIIPFFKCYFTAKVLLLFGMCLTPPPPGDTPSPISLGLLCLWLMEKRCFSYLNDNKEFLISFVFIKGETFLNPWWVGFFFVRGISQPFKHYGKGFLESTSGHLLWLPATDCSPNPHLITV